MRTLLLQLGLIAVLTTYGMAGVGPKAGEIAPGIQLLYSDFGSWRTSGDDLIYQRCNTMEIKPGERFGWRFRLKTEKEEVKMRVVLTLPAAPKQWVWNGAVVEKNESPDGAMKISPDRRTVTVEKEEMISDGWISDTWVFDHGDPYGDHTVRVYIGEQLIRVFRFRLREPKK